MTTVLVDVWIPGRPRPKGSLKRQGNRLVESNPESKRWRAQMAKVMLEDYKRRMAGAGISGGVTMPPWTTAPIRWTGRPVEVFWQAFFARPLGCTLVAPSEAKGAYAVGDKDKLERNILDALQGATEGAPGVLGDDSLVIAASGGKHWCDGDTPQGLYVMVWSNEDAVISTGNRGANFNMQRILASRGLLGSAGL